MVESTRAVIVAAAANGAIAATKYAAAIATGSAAMLSEGIHSTVDTCDQLLILIGESRSRKPPDRAHPFGHGQELYFWTLIVALVFFGVGGGLSVYEGVERLLKGEGEVRSPGWSYAALGAAAAFERVSFVVGLRRLLTERKGRSIWTTFRASKDPAILTVVGEDSAALVGIALAFAGIFLSRALHVPALDAVAAIGIGCVQATAAVLLARESRSLLLGEAVDRQVADRLRQAMRRDEAVEDIGRMWTMYFGPEQILLGAEVQFRADLSAGAVERAIDRLEAAVQREEPKAKRVFVEVQTIEKGTSVNPPREHPVPFG